VTVGSQVEAVGYPGGGEYSPSLESSTIRLMRANENSIKAVEVQASGMIVDKGGFSGSPYDSRLVQVSGKLEQTILGAEEYVLFLHDGGTVYTARLPKSAGDGGIPAVGSVVKVTGVCATRVDSDHEARSFRILLRSPADIVVVSGAPWWSASHAKPVVAVLLIAICLLAIWLLVVRREGRLRQLALVDPLTGLYNRRGFVLLAEHQMKSVLRNRSSLMLFYIDVNDFKTINDTLGHKQGDIALQTVAGSLRECFRKSDLIARLGGDEFAVSAVDASPDSGPMLEDRLNRIVEQGNMRDGRRFELSLSTGVLIRGELGVDEEFEELLAEADDLMYEKKRAHKGHTSDSSETGEVREESRAHVRF
jgi:diguanylate cyclase (GGDEF)-like protein